MRPTPPIIKLSDCSIDQKKSYFELLVKVLLRVVKVDEKCNSEIPMISKLLRLQ